MIRGSRVDEKGGERIDGEREKRCIYIYREN